MTQENYLDHEIFDEEGEISEFSYWYDRLEEELDFPFEAEISEHQSSRGPLQIGDKIRIISIFDYDELYGAIVEVRKRRKKYYFPLCDLKAVDEKSDNYKIVDEYAVWFANR